jgi:hypothetical protein
VNRGKTRMTYASIVLVADIGETRKNNLSNNDFSVKRSDVVLKVNG